MKHLALALTVAACGPGLAARDQRVVARESLISAANDPARLEAMMRGEVVIGGIAFADAGCKTEFGAAAVLHSERFHALAACLAGLHLRASTRQDALGDVSIVTYEPGYELEARVVPEHDGERLAWIGYEAHLDDEPLVPTVTADTLEALRKTGDANGPLPPDTAAKLELDPATAWVKVCIDADGQVTGADVRSANTPEVGEAFAASVKTWTFRPFATPACAMMHLRYPTKLATSETETLPFPAPPSRNKKRPLVLSNPKALEARRTSGRIAIVPIKSTGFAEYDRRILATMNTWVYTPLELDNQPVPVCTAITFIYNQH